MQQQGQQGGAAMGQHTMQHTAGSQQPDAVYSYCRERA
jgi:hypothetical protein